MPSIIPKDRSLVPKRFHKPLVFTRSGARQMRSSASCSSPKTEVAPSSGHNNAGDCGARAAFGLTHTFEQSFDSVSAIVSHQSLQLGENFAARRFGAKDEARNCDNNEQERRD